MHDPSGILRPVGYHQVHRALDDGFLFADKPTLQQYARDHAADPLDEDRVDQWIDKHPFLSMPLKTERGVGRAMLQTFTGADRTPTSRLETDLQLQAATPSKDWTEAGGGSMENFGEYMVGEKLLLSILGRAGQLVRTGERFKDIANLSQLAEKYPMIAKVLNIGASSVKAGTVAGAQTYAKTGDPGAALRAGVTTAALTPIPNVIGAGFAGARALATTGREAAATEAAAAATRETQAAANVSAADQEAAALRATAERNAAQSKAAAQQHAATLQTTAERNVAQAQATAEQQAAAARAAAERQTAEGRTAYAEHARGAIQPHLEATNAARNVPQQEVMMNQPGGEPAAPTGRIVATATGKAVPPQINIDQVLKQTHDFTGAADHLTAINDDVYNQFDAATGGRFRQLNAQVAEAQNAMRKGEQGAAQLYKQKLGEMDQLMDSTQGEMTPEMKAAAKAGFRQSYLLRDFGNLWDRNLNGVPGSSQASQTQRGINGKGLLTDLQRAVKLYGRPTIEEALGPGRLSNLEEIAQQNVTEKQRQVFNSGVRTVAQELQRLQAQNPAPATTTVAQELARLRAEAAATQGPAPAKITREIARLEAEAAKTAPAKAEGLAAWGKRSLAFTVGAGIGHMTGVGGFTGGVAGEATYETSRFVLNAIKTNPKIAQNFMFALQSGATAERYGPFIATMIQKAMTDSSLEQQRQQQEQER